MRSTFSSLLTSLTTPLLASLVALMLVLSCAAASAKPRPQQGEPCDPHGRCARRLVCVRYRGFAGAAGPEMTSCERRCHDGKCPAGQSCKTIADGPGEVCRPTTN